MRILTLVSAALLLAGSHVMFAQREDSGRADSPAVQLQTIITLELVDGQPAEAAKRYRELATRSKSADRRVAAQALLRAARSYEKIGSPESRAVYLELVKDYPDQLEAGEARSKLGSMGTPVSQSANGSPARRVVAEATPYPNWPFDNISADGRFTVTVVARSDGDISLALQDLGSNEQRRVLASRPNFLPLAGWALSPDGRQVAYQGAGSLNVVDTSPGATPRVRPAAGRPVAWSPDGQALLVARGSASPDAISELSWVAVNGSAPPRPIVAFENWRMAAKVVSLSPKGDLIAFSASPSAGARDRYIYIVNADGQNETPVVKIAGSSTQPVWTPDGSRLVFVNERSAGRALWAVALQGGRAASEPTLVRSGFTGTLLGITRSGDLYFGQTTGGDHSIAIRGVGVAAQPTFTGRSARWSPDERSVAFIRGDELIIRVLESGAERRHSQPGLQDIPPVWFHDSSAVAVYVDRPGSDGDDPWIYVATADGAGIRPSFPLRTLTGVLQTFGTVLSPDSKTAYALTKQRRGFAPWTGIVPVDMTTGATRPAMAFPVEGFFGPLLTISPDGETFAIMENAGSRTARLVVIRRDGTGYRELYGVFNSQGFLKWTQDSQSLVFSARDASGRVQLMRLSVEGGTPVPHALTSLLTDGSYLEDLNAEGTRMIATTLNPSSRELWVIDNFLSAIAAAK